MTEADLLQSLQRGVRKMVRRRRSRMKTRTRPDGREEAVSSDSSDAMETG